MVQVFCWKFDLELIKKYWYHGLDGHFLTTWRRYHLRNHFRLLLESGFWNLLFLIYAERHKTETDKHTHPTISDYPYKSRTDFSVWIPARKFINDKLSNALKVTIGLIVAVNQKYFTVNAFIIYVWDVMGIFFFSFMSFRVHQATV